MKIIEFGEEDLVGFVYVFIVEYFENVFDIVFIEDLEVVGVVC